MSISWQLRLVVGLCLIPVALLVKLFIDQSLKDINFATQEQAGVSYLRTAWPVLQFTLIADPATPGAADSAAKAAKAIKAAAASYDEGMQSADQSKALLGALDRWAQATPESAAAIRSESQAAVLALMTRVGDKSNLILDPDLDSYYMMDLALLKLPALMTRASDTVRASRPLAGGGSQPERLAYLSFEILMMEAHDGLNASLTAAVDGNPDGSLKKGPLLPEAQSFEDSFKALDTIADRTSEAAMNGVAASVAARDMVKAQVRMIKSATSLWTTSANELDRLLAARIAGLEARLYTNLAMALVALLLAMAAASWIARSLSSEIGQLVDRMRLLAANETDVDVPFADRQNEIGSIARRLILFREGIIERQALAQQVENDRIEASRMLEQTIAEVQADNQKLLEASAADQVASRERERAAIMQMATELEQSVSSAVEALSASAVQLSASANQMSSASNHTLAQTQQATLSSHQAESGLAVIAPTVDEMTGSIREISGQVNTAARIASEAVERVVMADRTVDSLATTANKIGEIVTLIDAIAEQTNLLALNATIEAARAGEAGKGFAVVANEVKSLANQTGNATREIAEQITAIQQSTQTAVAAIRDINRTVDQVSSVSSMIAAAIEEQTAAISEINRSIRETATGARGVVESISQVDRAAMDSQSAASQVVGASEDVSHQADQLRLQLAHFVTGLRQAHAA